MTARYIVSDVFDGLATLKTGSVDLVVTSPPFLALRSYLPADHPDKSKEIGSESTPAEFIDVMLRVSAELRRVLAPHGSICIELGDTYAGSGGAGGDDRGNERYPAGRSQFRTMPPNTAHRLNDDGSLKTDSETRRQEAHNVGHVTPRTGGPGWPLSKSKALIAELYRVALAYGINPLTGTESPAGRWRIRNVVTWVRPNPPVGALGDKWRPATSDLVVACTSGKRYWDDLATRKPNARADEPGLTGIKNLDSGIRGTTNAPQNSSGAPLLDWWEIPPGGYKGSHYAVYPDELVVPCVQAMCPPKVCRTCGEPSRRIVSEPEYVNNAGRPINYDMSQERVAPGVRQFKSTGDNSAHRTASTLGWSDCGHGSICSTCRGTGHTIDHPPGVALNENDLVTYRSCLDCVDGKRSDNWRPGLILDPFAGSGTTLAVATGYGHDAIGIDLDPRNAELALERVGPFLLEVAQ